MTLGLSLFWLHLWKFITYFYISHLNKDTIKFYQSNTRGDKRKKKRFKEKKNIQYQGGQNPKLKTCLLETSIVEGDGNYKLDLQAHFDPKA